ncbi:DNA mismatch repair protein MutL [Aaosphaeria arxii CBS 175.79]|uniref:DNA mismatch repair protein PMS1 n=1 Tax=Aaosphaeria arxii CBS 175.79 TaxID=1450172 RepID=A0A6A5XYD8_9PLEO|nr:DNA mismatch repair protein MutL [Aaosphaeria arxii CBS 175.79]KAF2017976.1 DNA mismatch repair protein MutL [Aaosphaeria arxii CBS 175.79]
MATIKPIEGRSVHQIQSGQVIVDLCSVAKELVENSVDAGATSIEVRFKNHGLDAIEVQDNGAGIAAADFDTLALKHYTSKLSTYSDLTSLSTFGFRGEALSSLCALSKFHVVTARADDGPKGTKLEFEQSGKLKGTSVVAAKQGTIVVVEQLFYNLPVRRKELEKTVKREYGKVLQLLNAYACISTGVKFSVSNQLPKGKKTVAFATQSNQHTRDNLANVYGAKTLMALIPLDLTFEMDSSAKPAAAMQSARNWSTQDDGSKTVKIAGHISRPVVGEGRQTPDRQMFFVNSRPCALPQVAKAFNEVYKSYNITQSPFIFADLKLDTNAYDVNVSPDKRTILLHDQTALLESLKNALFELFQGHDQSVPQAQLADRRLPVFRAPSIRTQVSTSSAVEEPEEEAASEPVQDDRRRQSPSATPEPPAREKSHLPGFVKASLIERFAERDTKEQAESHKPRARKSPTAEEGESLFVPEDRSEDGFDAQQEEDDVADSNARPPQTLSKAVQDFNARLASQHAKRMAQERSSSPPQRPHKNTHAHGKDPSSSEEEEQIPAVKHTPQTRFSQSTIQNAFDRMRPMRTPVQQATITVGDKTTVSTIGSSSRASKRARIHTPRFSLDGEPLSQTPKRSVMGSLRGFAAPGTQVEGSDDDEEEEGENEENGEEEQDGGEGDQDSSMPDASAERSPSPLKRQMSNGEMDVDSDPPIAPAIAALVTDPASDDEGEGEDEEEDEEPAVEQQAKGDDPHGDYIDDTEKKAREDAKVAQIIAEAEEAAARPSELNTKRAAKLFHASRKQFKTLGMVKPVQTSTDDIERFSDSLRSAIEDAVAAASNADAPTSAYLDDSNPEERLSLTVMKSDFNSMRIIGQFNLGFILAVRPPSSTSATADLFIIDQHASDEKYNFESFSANTILTSQRLVHPHPLELTAVEEEVILENSHALSANGFVVSIDTTGTHPVGNRSKLTALPMSKEVTFTPTDLEELLALLLDNPASMSTTQYVPRPSKVRKLLASRACRASIMIGKTLDRKKMERVVRHMGEMDKPWSCPHGRPTMRHLYGLDDWVPWREGDGVVGIEEDVREGKGWKGFLEGFRAAREG